jgi:ubiquinone/menaquinone biosynthesis C-methylase UbiE
MRSEEYRAMFELEDRLWWYDGMRAVTASLLEKDLAGRTGLSVLDVGCGTGYSIRWIKERFEAETALGVDSSKEAALLWKDRGIDSAAIASVDSLPFGASQFDLVTCFDVVYQLEEEGVRRALSEMHRVLKPGGLLFIREPAYEWLRGSHDLAVGTRHRFTLKEMTGIINSLGFMRKRATYANTLLFWAAVPHRILTRLTGGSASDVKPVSEWMNSAFSRALKIESRLLARMSFPFGLSVILLAEKRHD